MGRVGFEPTTNALKGHYSTTELPTQTKRKGGYVLPVMETSYPEHNSHFTLKISFTTRRRFLFCLTSLQVLQTRFELVRLAPTDFKSVVYTVPPPEDVLLYHTRCCFQNLFFIPHQQIYITTNYRHCKIIIKFDKKIKG